ncbi:Fic family protein [Schaalia turicensis]
MLVNALIGHFMVEHTHPFYDGNGRFGRFLLALNLKRRTSDA